MRRQIEYKGRLIHLVALPEQGRWGYRIDDDPVQIFHEIRSAMPEKDLLLEAEAAAKTDVDRQGQRSVRSKEVAG